MQVDYTLAEQLLDDAKLGLSPAMLHGALSGYLSSGASLDTIVLAELFETALPPVVEQLLQRLGEETLNQLKAEDFSFQPLLPAEESALAQRLAALSLWCDWFSVGFAAGFMRPQTDISPELMEILNDFGQFANVEAPEDLAADEEAEADFMELNEYVRMAVVTVYLQLNAQATEVSDEQAEPKPQLFNPDDPAIH